MESWGNLGKLEFPKFSECMAELRVDSLMSCGCGGGVSIVFVACWFWLELRVIGFRLGGVVWV